MEKFKSVFYKVMMVDLFIMSLIATVGALGNFYQTTNDTLNPLIIIFGVIVLILFFMGLSNIIKKISDKNKNIIAVILCIIFFVVLSIFGSKFMVIPSYDLSHVQRELMLMMQDGKVISNVGYFAKYTNQVPLAIILYYIYRLGSIINFGNLKLFAVIVNSFFIALTALFTYLSVRKIKNSNAGLVSLAFFVINPIFYLYASYFYTDTLCMPFAAISIYLFLTFKEKKSLKGILGLIISGFLLAIGFKIRVVVAIFLIGSIMSLWFNSEKFKSIVKTSGCLVGGFLIGIICYNLVSLNFTIPKDDTLEFPIYHWVMMGLNDEKTGRYNDVDHSYTKSQGTKELKKEADIKVIKERISDLGLFGYLNLWVRKININWSNGAYRYLDKMANIEEFGKGYEYIGGNNTIFILYALQICKGLILVIFTYLVFLEIRSKGDKKYKFMMISLFGAFLFYSIWEVQARYSLSFLPWLMILFPFGINSLEEVSITKLKDRKITKVISFIMIVLTLNIMVLNFPKYTIKESTFYDTRVNQVKTRSTNLTNLSDKIVEQTVKVDGNFNVVAIKFIKKDVSSLTHYEFSLLDNSNSLIYQESFTSDDVKNNSFKSFSFDKIGADNDVFTIRITSSDATDDNSIGIEAYNYKPYKVYTNGSLYVNGKDTEGAMTFKVQNKVKRTYTTKSFYFIVCGIILVIEGIGFYAFKDKNDK